MHEVQEKLDEPPPYSEDIEMQKLVGIDLY